MVTDDDDDEKEEEEEDDDDDDDDDEFYDRINDDQAPRPPQCHKASPRASTLQNAPFKGVRASHTLAPRASSSRALRRYHLLATTIHTCNSWCSQ